jgi:hypothetical protein
MNLIFERGGKTELLIPRERQGSFYDADFICEQLTLPARPVTARG